MAYANPEDQRTYARAWYARNKSKHSRLGTERSRASHARDPLARRSKHLRQYGITVEDYDRMLREQGGCCKTCGVASESQQYGRLHVDHRHLDGKVRALLCANCNRAVGLIKDNPEVADAIALLLRATH